MKIHVQVVDDETEVETEYVLTMHWDKAPDTGWGWWLTDVVPTPPNDYIQEKLMELAVRQLEEATNAALDAEEML